MPAAAVPNKALGRCGSEAAVACLAEWCLCAAARSLPPALRHRLHVLDAAAAVKKGRRVGDALVVKP